MSTSDLPEAILTRFRSLSLERLASIEATWASMVAGAINPSAIHAVARELHTLKGDAGGVGFQDVHVLAERLEELFEVAARVEYRMPEDLELVITIALQFIALLLRKKEGSSGIDVPGFLRQVDEVLRDARTAPIATPSAIRARRTAASTVDRVSEATRHRLAIAATNVFLESLGARATGARQRLRGVWSALCEEIARFQAVPLAKLLDRHVATAGRTAAEVGKHVAILVEVGDVRVDAPVAEAIDVALGHLLRNAIEHGIERRGVRRAKGKPETGGITISARDEGGITTIRVEDDGGGVDLAAVRARAIERGLIEVGQRVTDSELMELVFHPGFSTSDEVTDTSGRGVGLDAARTAFQRSGGEVILSSQPGAGTTVELRAPATLRELRCYAFSASGALPFAVSARWDLQIEGTPGEDAIDPSTVTPLPRAGSAANELALRLRWGFLDVVLSAATAPVLVTAERICPTPDDYPIEIVLVDRRETILVRPEHIGALKGPAE